jgi:hypothetical protein
MAYNNVYSGKKSVDVSKENITSIFSIEKLDKVENSISSTFCLLHADNLINLLFDPDGNEWR